MALCALIHSSIPLIWETMNGRSVSPWMRSFCLGSIQAYWLAVSLFSPPCKESVCVWSLELCANSSVSAASCASTAQEHTKGVARPCERDGTMIKSDFGRRCIEMWRNEEGEKKIKTEEKPRRHLTWNSQLLVICWGEWGRRSQGEGNTQQGGSTREQRPFTLTHKHTHANAHEHFF